MSTLFVDTINEKTSGNGIAIPGHVVQIQTATATEVQSAFSSAVDVITGTITPKYSDSKILVSVNTLTHVDAAGSYWNLSLMEQVGSGTATTARTVHSALGYPSAAYPGGTRTNTGTHILRTPNTTSQITYTLRVVRASGSGDTLRVNYSSTGDIVMIEIAQ